MTSASVLSAQSCRDARAVLKVTQEELAAIAEVSVSTVRRMERGDKVSDYAAGKLTKALEKEGALFVGNKR